MTHTVQTDVEPDRTRVLRAADRLYYARGIQAVGMDELRAESGVALKRIYQLFGSKEQIVLASLTDRRALWNAGIAQAAAGATDARGRLLAIFDFLAAWFHDDSFRGCGFINAFGELGSAIPGVAEIAREQKESFQRYVAELVAEAGAPASLAPQLAILAEGAQTTAAIAGTSEPAAHARAAAETLIDAALAAAPAYSA